MCAIGLDHCVRVDFNIRAGGGTHALHALHIVAQSARQFSSAARYCQSLPLKRWSACGRRHRICGCERTQHKSNNISKYLFLNNYLNR